MTTLTATVERIQVKSREFDLPRVLLTLIALPFFVVGWAACHGYRVLSVVCSWTWAAVLVGWQMAGERRRGPA